MKMALREILNKLAERRQESMEQGETNRKLTPDEVELMSFKERERLDNVKRELAQFRKQNAQEMIMGKNILTEGKSILDQENVFARNDRFPKARNSMMFR